MEKEVPASPAVTTSASQAKRQKNCIWFAAGNLIVKVKGEKQTHLHRVHSDILAFHSTVFHNMVGMPADPKEPMIDGCRVVELHDSPEHMYWLLQFIYIPGILPAEKLRRATLIKLEPILLLADKYEMEGISQKLLAMLEKDWPSTLKAWDSNEAEIQLITDGLQKTFDNKYSGGGADEILPEPCLVIALSRRCGLDSLLPSAFYHLSRLELNYVADLKPSTRFVRDGGRTADPHRLTARDLLALQRGKDAISEWCEDLVESFSPWSHVAGREHPDPDMPDCEECMSGFEDLKQDLEEGLFRRKSGWGIDPLHVMAGFDYDYLEDHYGLCRYCAEHVEEELMEKREEFWSELPEFFKLKAWPGNHQTL